VHFVQVDVFADRPYAGNPLAVFPDAGELSSPQMQAIASEMNLSETVFVTGASRDIYEVRIFTPKTELGFAGHPTIGTAWSLLHVDAVKGNRLVQRSSAGETAVTVDGDRIWFERKGSAQPDLEENNPDSLRRVASWVGLEPSAAGLEARELGRHGRLRPAIADAGFPHLMLPVENLSALGRCVPPPDEATGLGIEGIYCFTAVRAGGVRARGLFPPSTGAAEDPGTGSAAAALGLYLADRIDDIDFEIEQGIELGRPCRIDVSGREGLVRVGGRCVLVLEGDLRRLP
jgi:trans-2,3-dihydro-3-hydroxyanthranilate isomerase